MDWWYIIVYFAIALLAGMGVGSGGLLIAFLTFASDITHERAVGANLIFFVFALIASVVVSIKNKKLSLRLLLLLFLAGGSGAVLGSLLSLTVSKNLLRGAFAIFMIVAGSGTMVGTANTIARKYLRKRKIKQRKT